jgi:hypothetical protein
MRPLILLEGDVWKVSRAATIAVLSALVKKAVGVACLYRSPYCHVSAVVPAGPVMPLTLISECGTVGGMSLLERLVDQPRAPA